MSEKIKLELEKIKVHSIHGLIQRYERNLPEDSELPELLEDLRYKIRSKIDYEDLDKKNGDRSE